MYGRGCERGMHTATYSAPAASSVPWRIHSPVGVTTARPSRTSRIPPSYSTRSIPRSTTVISSNSGRCPGSTQWPANASARHLDGDTTNSSISFGFVRGLDHRWRYEQTWHGSPRPNRRILSAESPTLCTALGGRKASERKASAVSASASIPPRGLKPSRRHRRCGRNPHKRPRSGKLYHLLRAARSP
jgi:hypothetical protein